MFLSLLAWSFSKFSAREMSGSESNRRSGHGERPSRRESSPADRLSVLVVLGTRCSGVGGSGVRQNNLSSFGDRIVLIDPVLVYRPVLNDVLVSSRNCQWNGG